MLRIRPFPALRPKPNMASRVASVPYDVVNTAEARALADGNAASFLHVIRPEIDLPEGTDIHADEVYETARANLQRLIEEDILIREDGPRMYLYRQVQDHRSQVGLVCCCHIDDYARDIIKKHERTRKDKEDDRTRHMLAINANPGPVFLTYRPHPEIDRLIEADENSRPLYHFNAPDGVTHTVWHVDDASTYIDAFGRHVPVAYVADGHHRSASAARAGAERRAGDADHTGDEEYNWFMCVLFPSQQLHILPYNRVVNDLNGHSPEQVLAALGEIGRVNDIISPNPAHSGAFCFYLDGSWRQMTVDEAKIDRSDPVASLDVALLERLVLEPIFGISDIRTDPRIDFVGGSRGTSELERRVNEGDAKIAFSMYPTSIDQLLDVADAGEIMPPKSTWFEPKLRSGLFVHTLD